MNEINYPSTKIGYVYVVICPFTNIVRYVGSTQWPHTRRGQHTWKSYPNKLWADWKQEVFSKGGKPVVKFVRVCPLDDMKNIEADYYCKYRHLDLLNIRVLGRKLSPQEIDECIRIANEKKIKKIKISRDLSIAYVLVLGFFGRVENYLSGDKERRIRDYVLNYVKKPS